MVRERRTPGEPIRLDFFPVVQPVPRPEREPHPSPRRAGRFCTNRVAIYGDWHDAPRQGGRYHHHAQDIFGPRGAPILAPVSGRVEQSSRNTGPTPRGGHHVRIRLPRSEGGGYVYLAHLDAPPSVEIGDRVEAGQAIGVLGNSGAETKCPHLHIQARDRRRNPVNLYAELMRLNPTRGAGARGRRRRKKKRAA